MEEALQFCIHIITPNDKVLRLKQRINDYMEGKLEYWYPSPTIELYDNEMLDMVKVVVWPTHRMNIQNMEERCIMRSLLIEELMKIFGDLEIVYLMPLQINARAFPTTCDCLLVNCWNNYNVKGWSTCILVIYVTSFCFVICWMIQFLSSFC